MLGALVGALLGALVLALVWMETHRESFLKEIVIQQTDGQEELLTANFLQMEGENTPIVCVCVCVCVCACILSMYNGLALRAAR